MRTYLFALVKFLFLIYLIGYFTHLELSTLVKGLPLSKTTINNNDAHASALVNRLVADEILKMGY